MSLDTLSWSALIVSLVTVVVLVVLIKRMNRNYMNSLRCVASHMAWLQDDPDLNRLCRAIRVTYPDLCAGLDYELHREASGIVISKWRNQYPEPDQEQIKRMLEAQKHD